MLRMQMIMYANRAFGEIQKDCVTTSPFMFSFVFVRGGQCSSIRIIDDICYYLPCTSCMTIDITIDPLTIISWFPLLLQFFGCFFVARCAVNDVMMPCISFSRLYFLVVSMFTVRTNPLSPLCVFSDCHERLCCSDINP